MGRKSPPENILDKIRTALEQLKLPGMLEGLEQTAAQPDGAESRYELLWRLLDRQLTWRKEKTVARRIKEARFPASKTLDTFDFDFQTGVDRQQIMDLATLEFVRQGQNLLLGGMSGTGKSHLAISLGHLACGAQYRVQYTTSANMLSKLYSSLPSNSLATATSTYLRCDLLIIDEVGLDGPERAHDLDAQLFYRIIAPRYEASKSTIVTSNIPWKNWGAHFHDDIATVPILDRLVHHGFAVSIDGPSYRAKEHERLNAKKVMGD